MIKNRSAFTLSEMIVVIVIAGVVASLGYVQYLKMMERTYERHAILALETIRGAEKIYFAKHQHYWNGNGGPQVTASINAALGTQIQDIPGVVYFLLDNSYAPGYYCRALRTGGKWQVSSRWNALDGQPYCDCRFETQCPTCRFVVNGGCP